MRELGGIDKGREGLATMLAPDDVDHFVRAERLTTHEQKPVISFDCGVDDQLIKENRTFHVHLENIGWGHHYAEHPGDHT